MRRARFGLAGLALALPGGLALAQDGQGALPDLPAAFAATPSAAERPAPAALPAAAWIAGFGSDTMTGFVTEALENNPDLMASQARADAARARRWAGWGRLLPSLDLRAGSGRSEAPGTTGARVSTDVATATLTAGWEADVWGRLRNGARAGNARARASTEDLDFARLSIAGQTAQAYIDLVEATEFMTLADEDLSLRRRALDLTERRFESGVVNALSLRTARTQVASAEAAAAQAKDLRVQAARRLERLLGRYPAGAIVVGGLPPTMAGLPDAGAPEELLARRPDIRAAEARLAAAGFEARAARAALWPQLSFSATGSGQAQDLSDAFDADQAVTNLLANLSAPLFAGGALRAEARASRADVRASAAAYVDASLRAFGEVEDALSAEKSLKDRTAALEVAAREGRAAQELAEREYSRGLVSVFDLVDAISRRIDAERGLIQVRAARARTQITYHVALGVGAATGGLGPEPLGDTAP